MKNAAKLNFGVAVLAVACCLGCGGRMRVECAATARLEAKKFEMGVTEQNLQWTENGNLEKQLAQIDALAAAGAQWVRLTLRYPFAPGLLAHIKRANQRGVKVLVHLEGNEARFYPPGTQKRPGNYGRGGVAWEVYPFSKLDLARCEAVLREFFELLKCENATVAALEMFNEINWNAFNGDLPLVKGGLWIDAATPWNDPVFVKYRAGIEKVGQLTGKVSALNRELLGGRIKIITSGQVGGFHEYKSNPKTRDWMARVAGALVDHALTLRLLQGADPRQMGATNYLKFADGIGLHIYPETDADNLTKEIGQYLDPAMAIPGVGTTQPFWITESGYARQKFPRDTDRRETFMRFRQALEAYSCSTCRIATVLFYNFSSSPGEASDYALWENGALLPAGAVLQRDPL